MALPAFLVPGCDTSAGRAARRRACERANRPSQGRAGRGLVRGATPSSGTRRNRNNAHNCTPVALSLKPFRQPARLRSLSVATRPLAASGCTAAADASWRAGWPSPRLPAPTARGCLMAEPGSGSFPAPSCSVDGRPPLTRTCCRNERFCDSHASPPPRERDRPSRNPGPAASSNCGRGPTRGLDQLAPGTSWSGLGRRYTLLKTYNSVWQTLWQTRLLALDHATGQVLYLSCGVHGGAPRRNRTGDPILTIDAREVHNASQHLTYPYNRPGQRHRRHLRREAV
jgi:hypothetical protein